jgi:WD40 repeat protein
MAVVGDMLDLLYVSVGVNRSPHCIDWNGDDLIYAAGSAVVRAKCETDGPNCVDTMVAHSDRVNCVSFVSTSSHFVSGSTDGTVVFWSDFAARQTFKGHTGSVTSVAGLQLDGSSDKFVLASASADSSIRIWMVSGAEGDLDETIVVPKSGFANDLRLHQVGDHIIVFAATDDCNVRVYGKKIGEGSIRELHKLKGEAG